MTTETTLAGIVHLRNAPVDRAVIDPALGQLSETKYDYDETAPDSIAGAVSGHDAAFDATTKRARGNATTISYWTSATSFITATKKYDVLGNVTESKDTTGRAATYSYADNFRATCVTATYPADAEHAQPWTDYGNPTYALPTAVTLPKLEGATEGQKYTIQYDYCTGKPTTVTDPNNVATGYTYTDGLERLKTTDRAGLSKTAYSYSDAANTVETIEDGVAYGDGQIRSEVVYDGLGRVSESRRYEGANGCNGAVTVKREYDAAGRPWRVSNPYCPAGAEEWQTMAYDELDRVVSVTAADSTVVTTDYDANVATVTDESGHTRQNTTDGLGRIQQVVEDPGSGKLNHATAYTYDAADNLRKVTQGTQTRTFAYDSFARLICASNPETRVGTAACDAATLPASGAERYTYYNDGQLQTKTDTRGVTTTYGYDNLGRTKSKTYSDGVTSAVTWDYDKHDTASCPNGQTSYPVGRLTKVTAGDTSYTYDCYDALGRVRRSTQTTAGQPYQFSNYSYSPAGLTAVTYPSGRVVNTAYDEAGRPKTVASGTETYAASVTYAPHGGMAAWTRNFVDSANVTHPIVETTTYNNRLQPVSIVLTKDGAALAKLDYEYTALLIPNNGNVLLQRITAPKQAGGNLVLTQAYRYDALNRVGMAVENGTDANNPVCPGGAWCQQFGYDQWGNRSVAQQSGMGSSPLAAGPFSAATNRVAAADGCTAANIANYSWCYDAAGNLLKNRLEERYTYDAENRQTSALTAKGTATYGYDGDGRRVKRVTGTAATVYVYDAQGQLAAEYGGVAAAAGTQYRMADALGSTRVVTDRTGTVTARYDYTPFGEEVFPGTLGGRDAVVGYGAAGSDALRFTGKERDGETGLDYFGARYFSGAQGRFTSPDAPLIDQNPENPQSWNLYAYARSNPLRNRDLDGRICIFGIGNTCDEKPPPPPPPPPPPAPKNPVFPTPDQAGIAAARLNQQKQQQTGGEHASSVHTIGPAYTYTDPVTQGQATTVDPNNTTGQPKTKPVDLGEPPIPAGTQLVGESHSHPTESNFSFYDVQRGHDLTLKVYGHPLFQGMYLGLPGGEVRKYDPFTGRITVIAPKTRRR